jgi:hypothetical protein
LEDISFKEKMWLWVNDMSTYYTCICGKRTNFNKNWNDGYKKYCSSKCSQSNPLTKEKRKNTVLNKYGVDNVSKSDIMKKKQEETNIVRYGTKSSFQNEEVKNKWKDTINEKYGVDHYFKSDEFKIKSKKYYLEKYGVEHVWDVDEVKNKIKQTNLIRYGVETYLNTEHSRNSIKSYNKSKAELEIMEWLESIGIEYISSCVDIIYPKSIDIYIPSFSIGIEFSLKTLLKVKSMIFIGGTLQILLTTAAIMGIAMFFGALAKEAAFIGLLVSLSSTAIVLKVIQDNGTVDTPRGRISLAMLILQDIAIVPLMIFIPLS